MGNLVLGGLYPVGFHPGGFNPEELSPRAAVHAVEIPRNMFLRLNYFSPIWKGCNQQTSRSKNQKITPLKLSMAVVHGVR